MRWITAFFFLLFVSIQVQAQQPKIVKARSLVNAGKAGKAYSLLKKSYNKTGDREYARELIKLYASGDEMTAAMEWARKLKLAESAELDDAVLLTDLLIQQGEFQMALDKCIDYSLRYENAQPLHERGYICENLLKAKKNSILYRISEVPFNAQSDEICIANYRTHYVLTSNRIGEMADGSGTAGPFDLFILQKDFNKWRYPIYLLKSREKKYHRTTMSYTPDGNFVYYTLSDHQSAKSKKKGNAPNIRFRIFSATSMGNEWVEIEPLPFQLDGVNYKDPAIHPDGNLLVFSADLNKSGNYDLYYSTRENGKWSNPESLGKTVNTEADERMPTFNQYGRLFFSSNNKLGFGGYDLYETRFDNGIWLKARILPPPLNSTFNEFSLIESLSGEGGFLSSDRPGGKGGFDIYEYSNIDLKLGVTVLDASNGSLVHRAEIKLIKDGVEMDLRMSDENGIAEFRIGKNTGYELEIAKPGYLTEKSSLHSRAATEGRLLYWNVKLRPDASVNEGEEVNQNFVDFSAEVVDKSGNPIAGLPVRLVNTTTMKMKMVETDAFGKFSQSLLMGNTYEFIMNYENHRFVGKYSTVDLKDSKPKSARYTIGGN